MSEVQIVLCTFPDPSRARHIGTLLVEKQLAACVNLIPGLESIFSWKGKVSKEQEGLAIVPGGAFGDDHCVRLSCAVSRETISDGLSRLSRFLAAG